MLKFIHSFILLVRYILIKNKLTNEKISIIQRAVLATTLINNYTRPDNKPLEFGSYYIEVPSYNLHHMLSELQRYVYEIQKYASVNQPKDKGQAEKIRLDRWLSIDSNSVYYGLDIYTGYLKASELVCILHEITKNSNQISYYDRMCKRALTSYLTYVQLLIALRYTSKY